MIEIWKKRESFLYYSGYSNYMNTTIQLSKETKRMISTFGTKEETYDAILQRLYHFAVKEQLRELLLSSTNSISLAKARKQHAERWQKL